MTALKKERISTSCAKGRPDAICEFVFMVAHYDLVGEQKATGCFREKALIWRGSSA